jgi:hypothetical protein
MKRIATAVLTAFILGTASAEEFGWNYRRLDNIDLIKATYFDYTYLDRGVPVYGRGDVVKYRITLVWDGKGRLKNYPIEAGLFWSESTACNGRVVNAGDPLPDSYRSALQRISLSTDDNIDYFDVAYMIPNDVCPNKVEIRLHSLRGRNDPTPYTVREKFIIE